MKKQYLYLLVITFISISVITMGLTIYLTQTNRVNTEIRSFEEILNSVESIDQTNLDKYQSDNIEKESKQSIYESDIFNIVSYKKMGEQENFRAGGCVISNREFLIEVEESLYETSLKNMFNIINPNSADRSWELMHVYYEINPIFCGIGVVASAEFKYDNEEFNDCRYEDMLSSNFKRNPNTIEYSYYLIQESQPISLIEYSVEGILDNDVLTEVDNQEVNSLQICNDGYIY